MHGYEEKCVQFPWGNMKERGGLEDLSTEGRLILGIKQKGSEGKNQIHPALGRDN
jgi:hypothetical protein